MKENPAAAFSRRGAVISGIAAGRLRLGVFGTEAEHWLQHILLQRHDRNPWRRAEALLRGRPHGHSVGRLPLLHLGTSFFRVSLLVISVMSDQFRWASLCWGRRS